MVRVIRWVSKKTGKKWIHPIDTPLDKGDEIVKEVGTKTKVVGVTQVFIPNPLHPVVPYHVLILQDEHGNRMPKKTMKAYQVGDVYEDKPSAKDNAVAAVKIKYDYFEAVDEALELIGGVKVTAKTKILIKPNASFPSYAFLGLCTNPKTVEALIQSLIKRGAKAENITLAEQSFFLPFEKAAAKSGLPELIAKYKVKFVDIAQTKFEEKKMREFAFKVSTLPNEFDLRFNVPVIKTDMLLTLDAAFENLTRFLAKDTFLELAKDPKKAALALSLLPQALPSFITIGDASIGGQGNGPGEQGEPGFFNLIFAARNPVAHDTAVAKVLCLRTPYFVELAGKLGQGEYDIKKIEFVGNEYEALRRDIKPPIGSALFKKEAE
ncbi:MAG: DUF362 domain-containing protein [Nanoarchaeota archaeon]|nr:DUF362 domain-containing protein [Nanoarchaeota archaeon]